MTAGVVEWFVVDEDERVERVLASLRELGVERLRTGISWADWHREGGAAWYDRLLPRLAREVEVLPCVTCTPPSLGVVPRSSAPPRRLRDYADFVDTVIERYGATFEHVELWNEPNNTAEWDWRLDPHWLGFCELAGAAAHWARRRGKRTVLGGMSPIDPHWLGLLGERGVLGELDAVGVHGFPGTWEAAWDGWEAQLAPVREVLERYAPAAELWITEAGFSTWRGDVLGQARAFLDALEAPASRVYWYAAEDLAPERPAAGGFHQDEREYHFGLAAADGRPKLLGRLLRDGVGRVREVAAAAARRPEAGPRAVVLGGAGRRGADVARSLLAEGRRVVVLDGLSRPGSEERLLELCGAGAAAVVADPADRFALREALAGATEVHHPAVPAGVEGFPAAVAAAAALLEELRRLPDPPVLVLDPAGDGTVETYVREYAAAHGLPVGAAQGAGLAGIA